MIVQTDCAYAYEKMQADLFRLQDTYDMLSVQSIGKSVQGRELYCLRLGRGKNEVFYNGAHHALEWITALLLVKFCEACCKAYTRGIRLCGFDIRAIFEDTSLYIIPMVNPDGVHLVLNGIRPEEDGYEALLSYNGGNPDFSKTWQANFHGVDLNHNYDADFHKSREAEKAHGIFGPGCTRYAGSRPLSEPETRAVARFVCERDFRLVLAYHTQGREIYYDFNGKQPQEARKIGCLLARETGYALSKPEGIASFGGFKDWFIDRFKRPGFTIEAGYGKNPLPTSQFEEIYRDNLSALLLAAMI